MMTRVRGTRFPIALCTGLALGSLLGHGQARAQTTPDERRALAVADAALAAISDEDVIALTDLMVEGATLVAVRGDGRPTRAQVRANPMSPDLVERGFDGEVRITGDLATIWLPYDFYRDGAWSHCGVDVFTMARTAAGWRIVHLVYTVEQPPACEAHPDGPPGTG